MYSKVKFILQTKGSQKSRNLPRTNLPPKNRLTEKPKVPLKARVTPKNNLPPKARVPRKPKILLLLRFPRRLGEMRKLTK
jgi:hypothetical protein